MDPVSLIAILSAALPVLTAGAKKLFRTEQIGDENLRKGVHTLLPLVLGMASAALHAYATSGEVVLAIAEGLAAGGVASSVRDFDKTVIGLAEGIVLVASRKKGSGGPPPGS